jgi:hypothetical protein
MPPSSVLPMFRLGLLGALVAIAACGGDETAPPADDHTPKTYNVIINDVPQNAPYTLTVGQTSTVQIKFFNAAGDDLDDVETSHFAALNFGPSSLATATRSADHHYQFEVFAPSVGSGTLQVGFGHNSAADEKVFPAVALEVRPSATGGQ